MPDSQQWWVFAGSVLVFALLPGPGMLYVLARSLRGGRGDGVRSVFGNTVGATVHAVAAAFGLSALLATSAEAFFVVKILGAGYLLYLGVRALLTKPAEVVAAEMSQVRRGAFVQGVVSEVLNPKTAIYFLAFLPHFVNTADPAAPLAFLLLGVIAVLVATVVDFVVAIAAAAIGERMARSPRMRSGQRWVSGLTLIGLGGLLAASEAA
jgi:threonine/homoserine/homoserine lactone efflux protein